MNYNPSIPGLFDRCVPSYAPAAPADARNSIEFFGSLGDVDGDGRTDGLGAEFAKDAAWIEIYLSTGDVVLPAPVALTGSVVARVPVLAWEASDPSVAYVEIERAPFGSDQFEQIATTVTTSPYTDTTAMLNEQYVYRAISRDRSHNPSVASNSVTLVAANNPPVALEDAFSKVSARRVTGNVGLNDSDADSDTLSYSIVAAPQNGTANLSAAGLLVYEPSPGFVGQDGLTYRVTDGHGGEDTAGVELEVSVPNTPRVAVSAAAASAIVGLSRAPGGDVYLVTDADKLIRLAANLGPRYAVSIGTSAINSAAMLEDGTAYIAGQNTFLYAFGSTGAGVDGWPRALGSRAVRSLAITEDGGVVVCPENGVAQSISRSNTLRGTTLLGGACASSPVIFQSLARYVVVSAAQDLAVASISDTEGASLDSVVHKRVLLPAPLASGVSAAPGDLAVWVDTARRVTTLSAADATTTVNVSEPLPFAPIGEVLSLTDGSLFVAGNDGDVGALCRMNIQLQTQWCATQLPKLSNAPAATSAGNVLLLTEAGMVLHASGTNGAILSSYQAADPTNTDQPSTFTSDVLFDGQRILIGLSDGHLALVTIANVPIAKALTAPRVYWAGTLGGQLRNGRPEGLVDELNQIFVNGFEAVQ